MLGFRSYRTAAVTPAGLELVHRIRKRQFKIWTRLVEPLVVEETVGCGARMTSDSTSARQRRLVMLMHQIRGYAIRWSGRRKRNSTKAPLNSSAMF